MPHHSKHSHQRRELRHQSFVGGESNHLQRLPVPQAKVSYTIGHNPSGNWMPLTSASIGEDMVDREYRRSPYDVVPSSPQDVVVDVDSRKTQEGLRDENDFHENISEHPSQSIANVLLLAVAASSENERALVARSQGDLESSHENGSFDSNTSGSRPLKKRRNMDSMNESFTLEGKATSDGACHVSPISHGSKSGMTSDSNVLSHDTPSTSSAHSFDIKDDVATKNNADSSFVRFQKCAFTMIPKFPSVLYWLLSDVPASGMRAPTEISVDPTVLQWVSHGQAWRIIRWDFFHRSVLPAAFPQLTMETGGIGGSIDAFLWQLKAWGFEEIKDGPDIGAFAHTLFRRGHPLLCEEMKFAPVGETFVSYLSDSRSILRVPSLGSSNASTIIRNATVSDRIMELSGSSKDKQESLARSVSTVRSVVDYTGSPLRQHSFGSHSRNPADLQFGQSNGPPAYVNYSPVEINLTANGWNLSSGSKSQGPWTGPYNSGATQTAVDGSGQNTAPYSPLRIRSSRGARRHSLNLSLRSVPILERTMPRSRGFPISNRGKGRPTPDLNSAVNRNYDIYSEGEVAMLTDIKKASGTTPDQFLGSATEMKYPRSVLKRKLPMAANSEASI